MRRATDGFDGSVAGAGGSAHDGLAGDAPGEPEARTEAFVPARRNAVAPDPPRTGAAENKRAEAAVGPRIGQRRIEIGALAVVVDRGQIEFVAHPEGKREP